MSTISEFISQNNAWTQFEIGNFFYGCRSPYFSGLERNLIVPSVNVQFMSLRM